VISMKESTLCKMLFFLGVLFVLLLLIAGYNQKPDINMSEILEKSEEEFKQLNKVETTAAAFDGESDVKFRLMVEKYPTEEETFFYLIK